MYKLDTEFKKYPITKKLSLMITLIIEHKLNESYIVRNISQYENIERLSNMSQEELHKELDTLLPEIEDVINFRINNQIEIDRLLIEIKLEKNRPRIIKLFKSLGQIPQYLKKWTWQEIVAVLIWITLSVLASDSLGLYESLHGWSRILVSIFIVILGSVSMYLIISSLEKK